MGYEDKIQNRYVLRPGVSTVESIAFEPDGSTVQNSSGIIHEHLLRLFINDELYAQTTCTGDNLAELVVGKLICERMIESIRDVCSIEINEDGSRADIQLNNDVTFNRELMIEPSSCITNKVYFNSGKFGYEAFDEELSKRRHEIDPSTVFKIINAFNEGGKIHKKTKGTHSAYLFYEEEPVFDCEDIGRHNAMDKVIGYGAINGLDFSKCIVFTSGRVPVDMVQKVICARIPILISKAVVTDEGLRLAKESGLTLICKAWPDRYELFA